MGFVMGLSVVCYWLQYDLFNCCVFIMASVPFTAFSRSHSGDQMLRSQPKISHNAAKFRAQHTIMGRSTYMDNHGLRTSRLCLLLLIAGISNGESPFDTTGRFGLSRKLSSKWCVAKSCRIVSVDNWTVTTELFPFVKRPPPASIIAQIDSKLMRLF